MAADAIAVEDVLAQEAERRPRAGLAAIFGGTLTLLSSIALGLIASDRPPVFLIEALRDAAGENIGRSGLLANQLAFYDDHAIALVLTTVVQTLAVLLQGVAIVYLADAVKPRKPEFTNVARWLTIVGVTFLAIGTMTYQVGITIAASDFVGSSDQTTESAREALRSGVFIGAQAVVLAGTLALAFSMIMIPLNAMRVGLLTKFMGILGVIVGVTLVLPLDQQGVIRAFWMVSLGFLILGKWPRGMPPAWQTGRAEPWPTQQELREQREGAGPQPAGSARPEPTTDAPSPATSKRKRKRRG